MFKSKVLCGLNEKQNGIMLFNHPIKFHRNPYCYDKYNIQRQYFEVTNMDLWMNGCGGLKNKTSHITSTGRYQFKRRIRIDVTVKYN